MTPPSPLPVRARRAPESPPARRAGGGAAAALLARAGRVMAGSLDVAETIRNLATLAVPQLGDWCVVEVPGEGGASRRVEVAAGDPAAAAVLRHLLGDPPHAGRLGAAIAEVLATGRGLLVHAPADGADGADGCVAAALPRGLAPRSCLVAPLTARGRVIGALALVRTGGRAFGPRELRAAEELGVVGGLALQNAVLYAQAQRSTRMRDEVLGVVAHDLRNPLLAISMYAHLLSETGLSVRQQEWLDVMLRNAERMNALIQDLLDVSALEAGRLRMRPAPCVAGPLLAEALQLVELQARDKGVRLSRRAGAGVPPVLADRERVLQVLSNLLGNAVKFTPAGGGVALAAEARGAEVVFTVRDDGPGIAPGDLPRVFDRFWQAAGNRAGGAGLGLSIARGIVESHGGRIWAESVPGMGSVFSFTLPATQLVAAPPAADGAGSAPAAEEARAGDEVRVLLVDDHPSILRGLRELLRHGPGMTVVGEAEDADTAVRRAAELGPDVVLLDLNLPGGGLDATRRILAEHPATRVLILTAEPDDGFVPAALQAGARGYLRKSVEPAALLAALRAVRGDELVLDAGLRGWAAAAVPPAPADPLSADEERILTLSARGYGGAEIAGRLEMPVRTVNRLRTRAMRALGLSTRAELVRHALREGWLGGEGPAAAELRLPRTGAGAC